MFRVSRHDHHHHHHHLSSARSSSSSKGGAGCVFVMLLSILLLAHTCNGQIVCPLATVAPETITASVYASGNWVVLNDASHVNTTTAMEGLQTILQASTGYELRLEAFSSANIDAFTVRLSSSSATAIALSNVLSQLTQHNATAYSQLKTLLNSPNVNISVLDVCEQSSLWSPSGLQVGTCRAACNTLLEGYDAKGSSWCPSVAPFCCGGPPWVSPASTPNGVDICENVTATSFATLKDIYFNRLTSPMPWFSLYACCTNMMLLHAVNIPSLWVILIKTVTSTITTLLIATATFILLLGLHRWIDLSDSSSRGDAERNNNTQGGGDGSSQGLERQKIRSLLTVIAGRLSAGSRTKYLNDVSEFLYTPLPSLGCKIRSILFSNIQTLDVALNVISFIIVAFATFIGGFVSQYAPPQQSYTAYAAPTSRWEGYERLAAIVANASVFSCLGEVLVSLLLLTVSKTFKKNTLDTNVVTKHRFEESKRFLREFAAVAEAWMPGSGRYRSRRCYGSSFSLRRSDTDGHQDHTSEWSDACDGSVWWADEQGLHRWKSFEAALDGADGMVELKERAVAPLQDSTTLAALTWDRTGLVVVHTSQKATVIQTVSLSLGVASVRDELKYVDGCAVHVVCGIHKSQVVVAFERRISVLKGGSFVGPGALVARDSLAVNPRDGSIAACYAGQLLLWDTTLKGEVSKPVARLKGTRFNLSSLRYSPDGRYLAGVRDNYEITITELLWSVNDNDNRVRVASLRQRRTQLRSSATRTLLPLFARFSSLRRAEEYDEVEPSADVEESDAYEAFVGKQWAWAFGDVAGWTGDNQSAALGGGSKVIISAVDMSVRENCIVAALSNAYIVVWNWQLNTTRLVPCGGEVVSSLCFMADGLNVLGVCNNTVVRIPMYGTTKKPVPLYTFEDVTDKQGEDKLAATTSRRLKQVFCSADASSVAVVDDARVVRFCSRIYESTVNIAACPEGVTFYGRLEGQHERLLFQLHSDSSHFVLVDASGGGGATSVLCNEHTVSCLRREVDEEVANQRLRVGVEEEAVSDAATTTSIFQSSVHVLPLLHETSADRFLFLLAYRKRGTSLTLHDVKDLVGVGTGIALSQRVFETRKFESSPIEFCVTRDEYVVVGCDNVALLWRSNLAAQQNDDGGASSGGASLMELATLSGHAAPLTYAAMSADRLRVVTCSQDEDLRVFQRRNASSEWADDNVFLQAVLKGHRFAVTRCVFLPVTEFEEQLLASMSDDSTVRLWPVASASGEQASAIAVFKPAKFRGATRDVFCDNSAMLIVTVSVDSVALWDATARGNVHTPLATLVTPNTVSACFACDGKRIVSLHRDGTMKLWSRNCVGDVSVPLASARCAEWTVPFTTPDDDDDDSMDELHRHSMGQRSSEIWASTTADDVTVQAYVGTSGLLTWKIFDELSSHPWGEKHPSGEPDKATFSSSQSCDLSSSLHDSAGRRQVATWPCNRNIVFVEQDGHVDIWDTTHCYQNGAPSNGEVVETTTAAAIIAAHPGCTKVGSLPGRLLPGLCLSEHVRESVMVLLCLEQEENDDDGKIPMPLLAIHRIGTLIHNSQGSGGGGENQPENTVETLQRDIDSASVMLNEFSERLQGIGREYAYYEAETQTKMVSVTAESDAAITDINEIEKRFFFELKSLTRPPAFVLTILQCVAILLDEPFTEQHRQAFIAKKMMVDESSSTWNSLKPLLSDLNSLVNRLVNFKNHRIPYHRLREARMLIQPLTPGFALQFHKLIEPLHRWCNATISYFEVEYALENMSRQMAALQQQKQEVEYQQSVLASSLAANQMRLQELIKNRETRDKDTTAANGSDDAVRYVTLSSSTARDFLDGVRIVFSPHDELLVVFFTNTLPTLVFDIASPSLPPRLVCELPSMQCVAFVPPASVPVAADEESSMLRFYGTSSHVAGVMCFVAMRVERWSVEEAVVEDDEPKKTMKDIKGNEEENDLQQKTSVVVVAPPPPPPPPMREREWIVQRDVNAEEGQPYPLSQLPKPITVECSIDGRHVAVWSSSRIIVLELTEGQRVVDTQREEGNTTTTIISSFGSMELRLERTLPHNIEQCCIVPSGGASMIVACETQKQGKIILFSVPTMHQHGTGQQQQQAGCHPVCFVIHDDDADDSDSNHQDGNGDTNTITRSSKPSSKKRRRPPLLSRRLHCFSDGALQLLSYQTRDRLSIWPLDMCFDVVHVDGDNRYNFGAAEGQFDMIYSGLSPLTASSDESEVGDVVSASEQDVVGRRRDASGVLLPDHMQMSSASAFGVLKQLELQITRHCRHSLLAVDAASVMDARAPLLSLHVQALMYSRFRFLYSAETTRRSLRPSSLPLLSKETFSNVRVRPQPRLLRLASLALSSNAFHRGYLARAGRESRQWVSFVEETRRIDYLLALTIPGFLVCVPFLLTHWLPGFVVYFPFTVTILVVLLGVFLLVITSGLLPFAWIAHLQLEVKDAVAAATAATTIDTTAEQQQQASSGRGSGGGGESSPAAAAASSRNSNGFSSSSSAAAAALEDDDFLTAVTRTTAGGGAKKSNRMRRVARLLFSTMVRGRLDDVVAEEEESDVDMNHHHHHHHQARDTGQKSNQIGDLMTQKSIAPNSQLGGDVLETGEEGDEAVGRASNDPGQFNVRLTVRSIVFFWLIRATLSVAVLLVLQVPMNYALLTYQHWRYIQDAAEYPKVVVDEWALRSLTCFLLSALKSATEGISAFFYVL